MQNQTDAQIMTQGHECYCLEASSLCDEIRYSVLESLVKTAEPPPIGNGVSMSNTGMKIRIVVDDQTIAADLDDIPWGRDFEALLPLDLKIEDYHRIEKIADLPRALNTDGAPRSHTAAQGDITYYAPWGNLAIFYKAFGSAAGLVRLGRITGDMTPLLQDGRFAARIELAD